MERRPEAIHLDQNRRTNPRLPQTTSTTNYRRRTLAGLITVSAGNGVPAGIAVLAEIRRHVHKKAANEAADSAEPGAKNAASGIDYLRLVETRHKGTMAGEPISFVKASTPTGPIVVFVPSVSEDVR